MNRMKISVFVPMMVLAGCILRQHEGQLACETDDDCVAGWYCVDGHCYSSPEAAGEETEPDAPRTYDDGDTDTPTDLDGDSTMATEMVSDSEGSTGGDLDADTLTDSRSSDTWNGTINGIGAADSETTTFRETGTDNRPAETAEDDTETVSATDRATDSATDTATDTATATSSATSTATDTDTAAPSDTATPCADRWEPTDCACNGVMPTTLALTPADRGLAIMGCSDGTLYRGVNITEDNTDPDWWLNTVAPNDGSPVIAVAIDPSFPDTYFVAYAGCEAGVTKLWKTTNTGESFEPVENAPACNIYSISMDSRQSGLLYVVADNAVYQGTNYGETWTTDQQLYPELRPPEMAEDDLISAIGFAWNSGTEQFRHMNEVVVGTASGNLWMTFNALDDEGPVWTLLTVSRNTVTPTTTLVTHFTYDDRFSPDFFYVSYGSTADSDALWRSMNGGQSRFWQMIQNPALPAGSGVGSLSLNPYDSNVVYAVTLTPVAGYVSFDRGDTWYSEFPD